MKEYEITYDNADFEWTLFEHEPTDGMIYGKVEIEEYDDGEKLYEVHVLAEDKVSAYAMGVDLIEEAM